MKKLVNWYRGNYKIWEAFKKFPEAVQSTGRWPSETYLKYPPQHDFGGKSVLNFGCGKSTYAAPNVVNLDVVSGPGINVVTTEKKLPFEDNSFDLVLANHVLEHVPDWFATFQDFARIVKPGGIIEVWIPPISSDSAFSYRDHINRIGLLSFSGCASMPRAGHNALAEHEFKELGDISKLEIVHLAKRPIITWWTMLAWPSLLDWMCNHLRNIVSEENYVFRKKV